MSRTTGNRLFSIAAAFGRNQTPLHVCQGQCSRWLLQPTTANQNYLSPLSFNFARQFSSHGINKNLELWTQDNDKIEIDRKSLTVKSNASRPLVVILAWIAARKNHVQKFSDLYLKNGYDVLVVPSTALQCLFPVSGSQVVAEDLLRFLAANPSYKKVVVHGFSVGGYLWGEVCLKLPKYPTVSNQLIGQVWDSLVDVVGAGKGVAAAVFPKNAVLRGVVRSLIQFYMKIFENVTTKHHRASSACFYDPPLKVPSVMFLSRSDPICSFQESLDVAASWQRQVKVTIKIWDDSPHVGHLRLHTAEYLHELNSYLKSINMPTIEKV